MDLILSYFLAFLILPPKRFYDIYVDVFQRQRSLSDLNLTSKSLLISTGIMLVLVALFHKPIKWYKTMACWYLCLFIIVIMEYF